MSSPSLAVGWSIWQRHRRGLMAVPALFAAAALDVDQPRECEVLHLAEVVRGRGFDCDGQADQRLLELNVESREPRQVSEGEVFHVPSGLAHYTRVLGDTPVRILAIWVIEKGKPAMQPVPK